MDPNSICDTVVYVRVVIVDPEGKDFYYGDFFEGIAQVDITVTDPDEFEIYTGVFFKGVVAQPQNPPLPTHNTIDEKSLMVPFQRTNYISPRNQKKSAEELRKKSATC